MMTHLREFGQGVVAKAILLLLVGSFVLWGIGDVFRQGSGPGSVATVARSSISTGEYMQALRRRQEELRQMLGSAYKPGLLKKLGIEQQVLFSLINTRLIDKESESLGIEVSDDEVIDSIRNNPAFADRDGHFSKELYLETLKNNNIAEARYVGDIKKEVAAKLLTDTLVSSIIVPDSLVRALYKTREEQRVADFIVLSPANVSGNFAPVDKEVQDYYSKHKDFTAPEMRTISYVTLKAEDIQNRIDVPEEDVERAYTEHLQEYHKPEQRELEQMLFEKEADAKNAEDQLKKGVDFNQVAAASAIVNKDKLSLGDVSRQDVPAEAADQVFALKQNGVSAPVKTAFGWHIFKVVKITPESTLPLEQARGAITKELGAKIAQDTLYKLVADLEDALAGGATLETAAQKVGEKVSTLGPVTHDGMTANGKKASLPEYDNFLNVAFSTNEKDHSQATQANDGSYFLVYVDKVEPEHDRPLAEVSKQVEAALEKEKRQKALSELANNVAMQLGEHKPLSEIAAKNNVNLSPVPAVKLKRNTEMLPNVASGKKPVPHELVQELFKLKAGDSTHAYALADGSQVIATKLQIIPAPAQPEVKALDAIKEELKKTMLNERLGNYLSYLQVKYRVTVNEAALGVKEDDGSE